MPTMPLMRTYKPRTHTYLALFVVALPAVQFQRSSFESSVPLGPSQAESQRTRRHKDTSHKTSYKVGKLSIIDSVYILREEEAEHR